MYWWAAWAVCCDPCAQLVVAAADDFYNDPCVLACGFLTKAQCIQGVAGNGGVVQLNWSGHRQFVSACYTDIVPLYAGDGGLSHYLNMPALSALLLWG